MRIVRIIPDIQRVVWLLIAFCGVLLFDYRPDVGFVMNSVVAQEAGGQENLNEDGAAIELTEQERERLAFESRRSQLMAVVVVAGIAVMLLVVVYGRWVRRTRRRWESERRDREAARRVDAWAEAGKRAETPSAAELEGRTEEDEDMYRGEDEDEGEAWRGT